jgi:hypothetical protein
MPEDHVQPIKDDQAKVTLLAIETNGTLINSPGFYDNEK